MKNIILMLLVVFQCQLSAQFTEAYTKQPSILIENTTAHIGNGKVVQMAFISIKAGKIESVSTKKPDSKSFDLVIDGKGKHVYPGFIAPNNKLGLTEVDAVRATRDFREVGLFNPSIKSRIAYNTDSDVIPTVMSNGVLLTQATPQGGRISGTSSVMLMSARNWEEATYKAEDGIHVHWPKTFTYTGWWAEPGPTKINKKFEEQLEELTDFIDAAKAYIEVSSPDKKNLKFEAMRGLFDQSQNFYAHVDDAKGIVQAIYFGKKYGFKTVIIGGGDAYLVTDELKNNNVSVILKQTTRLPSRPHDDVYLPYKIPKLLKDAGVLYCLGIEGGWEQRNLVFQAGQAVGQGLNPEDALTAITLNAAKIFGLDKVTGSLESGKDANLIISTGDVLDVRTSNIETAFILGRPIDLKDKQKKLYEEYMNKFGLSE